MPKDFELRTRLRWLVDKGQHSRDLSTILVILPLAAILLTCSLKGASSLNLAFFTQIPKPVGESGGGMANAIVGSVTLLGIASLLGGPIGIGGGVYLAELAAAPNF